MPWAHEPRASHAPRPRTRSGLKASEKAGDGEKGTPLRATNDGTEAAGEADRSRSSHVPVTNSAHAPADWPAVLMALN